jgi:hypothetical protein
MLRRELCCVFAVGGYLTDDWQVLRNIMPARCGRSRDVPRRFRTGAPPRPRCRGGLPPVPVQRAAPGPLLDSGRRSQYARPVDVRPAQRTGLWSRRRGGTTLSKSAVQRTAAQPKAHSHTRPRRIARSGAAALRHVASDPPDARRDLSVQSRHQGCTRCRRAAVSSALLLSPGRQFAD